VVQRGRQWGLIADVAPITPEQILASAGITLATPGMFGADVLRKSKSNY
jgi:hypothetical protein